MHYGSFFLTRLFTRQNDFRNFFMGEEMGKVYHELEEAIIT